MAPRGWTCCALLVLQSSCCLSFTFPVEPVLATRPFALQVGCNGAFPYVFPVATSPTIVLSFPVDDTSAEFVSFNFTWLHLPPNDYLRVRTAAPTNTSYTYRGRHPNGFLTTPLYTGHVLIDLISFGSTNSNCNYGFAITEYRYAATPPTKESSCDGSNSAASPACDQRPTSPYWRGARAIVRLLVNSPDGSRWCTGWLVGCQNHVLTNAHCIGTADDAAATTFDLRAFGKCNENCAGGGRCSNGNMVVGSTLVATSQAFDYSLVQLNVPTNVSAGNYLRLHESYVVGSPVYIPQHPLGGGMVMAIKATGGQFGLVYTSTYANPECGLEGMLGYKLNTSPGSSGAPIISTATNGVVGMHSCGGCAVGTEASLNGGIPAPWIVQDLRRQNALPNCAVAATSPVDPTVGFATVRGTLYASARGVSLDVYELQVDSDGVITVDVQSVEATERRTFTDVDRNCDASYFDSRVFVVDAGTGAVVAENDRSVRGNGRADGSVSDSDAFVNMYVDAGAYYIVVGTTDMTDVDARAAAVAFAQGTPAHATGTLFECGLPTAAHGHYTLTLRTNMDVESITSFKTPDSGLPSTCSKATRLEPLRFPAKCPYHARPPLALQYMVDGTIHQRNGSVSIDQVPFEVVEAAHIGIEIVSYQILDDGTRMPNGYGDAGICGRTFVDAVAYVFEDTTQGGLQLLDTTRLVAMLDDKPPGVRVTTSRSSRDPYLDLYLPKGKYVLVVGQYPLHLHETVRMSTSIKEGFSPHKDDTSSDAGNYHVMFLTESHAVLLPPTSPPTFVDEPCSDL
ncbi:hypothetical protein DYB37_005996 [Aphanomyces astaci]|uniref:Serine protease n=1 Tax=Aphanomyces astaci TaxID=112090 RepID=A0A3R7BDT9_APHAT|nr:hypothetical protein DYB35_007228 [Aphanomyces astaci]RHZ25965.1 hypothetical protein DYB37_005996 [Aphanomyces astaci]